MCFDKIKNFEDIYSLMLDNYSERIAFRWVDENETVQERSYGEFCSDIRRSSCWLHDRFHGSPKPHVAILARNSYDYLVNLYACLTSGYIVIPLNIQKSTEEILFELAKSDTSVIVHDGEFIDRETDFLRQFSGELFHIDDYRSSTDDSFFMPVDPYELSCIYFTSGTTDRSKGVMLNQRALIESYLMNSEMGNYCRTVSGLDPDSHLTWLLATPLYHVIGFSQVICAALEGGTVNMNTNVRYFFRDILLMPSQITWLTPVYIQTIQKKLRRGNKDFLGGLNTIAYAGAPIQICFLDVLKKNGIDLMQFYGLTEVFTTVALNCSQQTDKLLAIGKECTHPLWKYKCRLIDSELCIHADRLIMGYYNDAKATEEAIDKDGWFHTGDLAAVDDDGYYYITGRKKNLIILSGGENVNPEELEKLLLQNEDIIETVVCEKNCRIAAQIYCEQNRRDEINRFVQELNRTIPMYKHISLIEFRDTPFERTSTGKIKR